MIDRDTRKARDRLELRQKYDQWRAHPFTELYLSYLRALSDGHKEMAVLDGVVNRDVVAAKCRAFSEAANACESVYQKADNNIELKYMREEQADGEFTGNQVGSATRETNSFGDQDI